MSASRFLALLPALVVAEVVLGVWALGAALSADAAATQAVPETITTASLEGILAFLRSLPLVFVLSWPLLRLPTPRMRLLAIGGLWTLLLLPQVALDQYFLTSGTPLGADLFGYSMQEIATTITGAGINARMLIGWLLPVLLLWVLLVWRARREPTGGGGLAWMLVAVGMLSWIPAWAERIPQPRSEALRMLAANKPAYFINDSWRYWRGAREPSLQSGVATEATASAAGPRPIDPAYPFLREDDTPDALGPLFDATSDGRPPNLVVIIVEGLGRSFSGPDSTLGSFTPFLDELAARSLYFDNFLANQGRTFGVLPSLFGSLPMAENGFLALGARMPAQAGLFNILQRQGYHTRFYNGTDLSFDNERAYLQSQGVETLVDLTNFGPGYQRNPFSSWGYPDHELVSRVLADGGRLQTPFLLAMQTISMHTSYRFPGQDAYRARFEQRLDALEIPAEKRSAYRQNADIYSSVLYTDDELRRFFAAVATQAWYRDTIFVITGDHRLPEIPMDEYMERFHVPLIVFSPLLRKPMRVAAVSSHLDVTPSLLALLADRYGLQRPDRVTWVGQGLDLAPEFRNQHDIPLKHTKTSVPDFVSGTWLLHEDALYSLDPGFTASPEADDAIRAQVGQRLARYEAANDAFLRTLALSPEGDRPRLVGYSTAPPSALAAAQGLPTMPGLSVADVHWTRDPSGIALTATFENNAATPSRLFVPLAALSTNPGSELQERYGPAIRLQAGERRGIKLHFDVPDLQPGRYDLAVLPSDPDNGKVLGRGRYRIPLDIMAAGR